MGAALSVRPPPRAVTSASGCCLLIMERFRNGTTSPTCERTFTPVIGLIAPPPMNWVLPKPLASMRLSVEATICWCK